MKTLPPIPAEDGVNAGVLEHPAVYAEACEAIAVLDRLLEGVTDLKAHAAVTVPYRAKRLPKGVKSWLESNLEHWQEVQWAVFKDFDRWGEYEFWELNFVRDVALEPATHGRGVSFGIGLTTPYENFNRERNRLVNARKAVRDISNGRAMSLDEILELPTYLAVAEADLHHALKGASREVELATKWLDLVPWAETWLGQMPDRWRWHATRAYEMHAVERQIRAEQLQKIS